MTRALSEIITVRGDDLTLPLLLWRRFRRPMPGLAERVLDINPHLAALGPVLPLGTRFILPLPAPAPAAPRVLDPIRLW